MQCQVKIICCLAFLLAVIPAGLTRADESSSVPAGPLTWETLTNERVHVEPYSSAQGEVIASPIPFFRELGTLFWSWDPANELKKPSDSIYLEPSSKLDEIMTNLFVQFDTSDTAHFRKVWFHFTPDLRFRGLFALHDFQKKRPFVILRMGIHGNVDEMTAERFLVRALYDDLGANVVVLESSTSAAFLAKNDKLSFGGVEEGLQTFLVLREILNSPMEKITADIHLLGLSLGGQGTFLTAALDQYNGRHISSIVNLCPLINLQQTFEYHSRPGLKNSLVDLWNTGRLKGLLRVYGDEPEIRERWKTFFDFKPRFTPAILKLLNRDRHEPLITTAEINRLVPGMKWPAGLEEHLRRSPDFFTLNNFWPYYQGITTPMTIYTTPHDELVINELNSEMIFAGRQPGDFSHLRYERLDRAIHCGLASVYRWDYVVKLLKDGMGLNSARRLRGNGPPASQR